VGDRLPEDPVGEQPDEVVEPDEVGRGGHPPPVGHRDVERLRVRRDHVDQVERDGRRQEGQDEQAPAVGLEHQRWYFLMEESALISSAFFCSRSTYFWRSEEHTSELQSRENL